MKMKKLISFLCAAALTVSSFAGLAVTASAETPKSVTVAVDAGDTAANVTTTESSAVSGVLLLAKYSNNALTSLNVSSTFTTPQENVALGATYAAGDKIMAWNSLAGMEPLTVTVVAKPIPSTAVSTVADLTVTDNNDGKAPATITAAVTAKQDAEFEDTTSFTYAWTKDNEPVADATSATLADAEAGTYTVTATYNGDGNYEGSLGPKTITIKAADDNRTTLDNAKVTVTPAGDVYKNTELTAAVTIPGATEEDDAVTVSATDLDYAWSKKGDSDAWTPVDGATAATFTPTEVGTYKVTVTAKAASENYVGTVSSAEINVIIPADYVTSTDGKVKAISVMGKSGKVVTGDSPAEGTDVSGKTYKELKELGAVSQEVTRGTPASHTGGQTALTEGVILASSGGDSPIAVIEVDASTYKTQAATDKITLNIKQTSTVAVGADISIAKVTSALSKDFDKLTSADVKELTLGTATVIDSTGNGKVSDMAYNIEDDIAALGESDTVLYYVVTVASGRETKLSDFAITSATYHTASVTSGITGGTVTADKTSKLVAGDKVTVTIAATEGYDYTADSLSVKDASNAAVTVTAVEGQDGKYEFTMPDSNVTITAAFAQIQLDPSVVTINYKNGEDTVKTDTVNGYIGRAIDLTGKLEGFNVDNAGGATFKHYTINSGATTSVTPASATETVDVAVSTNDKDYYYYEDFETSSTAGYEGGTKNSSLAATNKTGDNTYFALANNGQSGGRDAYLTLKGAKAISDDYVIEMDLALKTADGGDSTVYLAGSGTAANASLLTLTGAKSASVWTLANAANTPTYGFKGITMAAYGRFPENPDNYKVSDFTHIKITVDFDSTTATVVLDNDSTKTYTLTVPAGTVLSQVYGSFARYSSGAAIDNIEIYKYTAPPAPTKVALTGVTLSSNAESDAAITVGTVLTATIAPTDATGVTYKWYRGDDEITANADKTTYTVTEADQGKTIKVVAKDNQDTPTTKEASKAIPAASTPSTKTALTGVTISGTAKVGDTLTATVAPNGATATYQWKKADTENGEYTNITGATNATYELTANEQGKFIKVEATGTGEYDTTVLSNATAAVEAASNPKTDVTAATAEIAKDGVTLTASVKDVDPEAAADAFTAYAWTRSETENGEYTSVQGLGKTITAEKGYFYKVAISIPASNETYNAKTVTSAAVEVPADPVAQATTATITAVAADKSMYGKTLGDLTDGFTITGTDKAYTAKGTLKYVTGYTDFSSNTDEQSGNYLPFVVNVEGYNEASTIKIKGNAEGSTEQVYNYADYTDGFFVFILGGQSTALTIKVDRDGEGTAYTEETYTLSWEKATSADEADKLYFTPAPTPLTKVELSGEAKLDQTLTATVEPSGADVSYKWYRAATNTADTEWAEIADATAATYTLVDADVDNYVKVVATAGEGFSGEVNAVSAKVEAVLRPMTETKELTFTATEETTYTATTLIDDYYVRLYAKDGTSSNGSYNQQMVIDKKGNLKLSGKGTFDASDSAKNIRVVEVLPGADGTIKVDWINSGSAPAAADTADKYRLLHIQQGSTDTTKYALKGNKSGDEEVLIANVEANTPVFIYCTVNALNIQKITFTKDEKVQDVTIDSAATDATIALTSGTLVRSYVDNKTGVEVNYAKVGDTVTVTVTPGENKAVTAVTANDTTAESTNKVEATQGENNTWTFTMPAYPVSITAEVATVADTSPHSITVNGAASVDANTTSTYTATVYDTDNNVTTKSGVTWAVYTDSETTTTAENSSISAEGVLTVGANETSTTLYIVATSSVEGSENVKSDAKAVTVNPVYVKQLVSFTRLTDEGAAIPSGYVEATVDSDNAGFFLAAVETIAENLTGEAKLEAAIEEGKAELYLNPNKTYKLTLKTAKDGDVIAQDIAYTPSAAAEETAVNNAVAAAATPAETNIPDGVSLTENAIPGDKVTITLPEGDYVVNSVKVYKDAEGKEEVEVTKDEETGKYTFVMPVGGVAKVEVDKTDLYAVNNTTTDTNGSISFNKEKAAEKDTVEITVTPKDNTYILDTLIVKDVDDGVVNTTENEGKYTFTMPAKAVNVTATFKLVSYTVTFETNGGSTVEAATVEHGAKVTKPATDPTKDGKVFDGWYADAEFETEFNFDSAITAATTIYAKWTDPAPTTFAVTVNVPENGVASVNLKKGDETVGDAVTTFTENKAVFEGLEAGDYTIVATAKAGYTISAIKVGETEAATVTVSDADVSNVSVEVATKWQAMGTPAADSNSIAVDNDGVTTLTVKNSNDVKFTYDLAADLNNLPTTWEAADGELVVTYDLDLENDGAYGDYLPGNDWFIDLSTANTNVGTWSAADNARFGRLHVYRSQKTGFIGGSAATNAGDGYVYQSTTNDFVTKTFKTVTNRVDLKNKNVFAGQYGDGALNSVLIKKDNIALNDGKLYLNIGLGGNVKADTVIKVKNVTVQYLAADAAPTYAVTSGTVTADDNETLSFNPESPVRMGETVTVTPSAKKLAEITAAGALSLNNTGSAATFIMPAQAVSVDATITDKKLITLVNTKTSGSDEYYEGGTISVASTTASPEATVTVTGAPYFGYKLSGLTITGVDEAPQVTVNEDNTATFAMPDADITVAATWTNADDDTKVLKFEDATLGGDNVPRVLVETAKLKWLCWVQNKSAATFADVDFTKLSKVTIVAQTNNENVTANLYKGSAETAFATKATTGEAYALGTPNQTMYKVEIPVSAVTGTDSLKVEFTGGSGFLGNYWYIVLEYSEGTTEPEPETYTITLPTVEHGTVTVTAPSDYNAETGVAAETSVTLTVDPDDGYQLKSISAVQTGTETAVALGDPTAVDDSDNTTYTFSMPAGNVTVSAEFEFVTNVTITADGTYIDSATDTADTDNRPTVKAGAAKVSGGAITSQSAGNSGYSTAGILSVDASKYVGRIHKATLTIAAVAEGAKTTLRLGQYANYIDFAENDKINATNIVTLGGTAATVGDIGEVQTSSTDLTYDITSILRSSSNGKKTLFLLTSTARMVTATDVKVKLEVTEDTIPAAAVTVHKVYKDNTNGTITIDDTEDKYVEFGTNEEIANTAGYYVGDNFTPAATYTTAIDDGETSRYEYVSGVAVVELEDETNDVYIVYNKIDYQTTTFSVTLPAAAGEGGKTVNVKLAGTPTSTGAAAADTNVAVTVAAGETTGTATYKLLPGTYTYAFVQTEEYLAKDAASVTVGSTNAMTLEANEKTETTATVNYVTNLSDVENTTVKTATITGIYEGDSLNIEDASYVSTYLSEFKIDNTTPADTFKRYTVNAYEADTYKIASLSATASNNVINVIVSTNNKNYYYYEDFSDYDLGTAWSGVTKASNSKTAAVDDSNIGSATNVGAQNGLTIGAKNKAMAWSMHNKATQEITRPLEGSGSVEVSFKMAVNSQSGKGRRVPIEFLDENGNSLITIYGEGSKTSSTQGIAYSIDGGKTFTRVETTGTDASFHTFDITFDMTNHKISLSYDGVAKVTNENMYAGTTEAPLTLGANVASMHTIQSSFGVLAGVVFDDYAVSQYTAE